jgi:hypothetical protein
MLAHEMLHVRQKSPKMMIMDKNEREWQAYYEMLFHATLIPELSIITKLLVKKPFYYGRMAEGSELQQKYAEQKLKLKSFYRILKIN